MMRYLVKKRYVPLLMVMDALGNAAFIWKKFRRRPKAIRKVLFIRLEHIGDMVMTTPVFEAFKKCHPGCKVHVLCRSLTAPLIENNPNVDKVMEFDAPWFRGERKSRDAGIISRLKNECYDVVFEMHGDPRSNYLASRTGAYSVGYACRGAGFFLNKVVRFNPKAHVISQNFSLIAQFCSANGSMHIYTSKAAVAECAKLMKSNKLKKKKFVIINPRSGRPEKDMTDAEVFALIKKIREKVVITGSAEEAPRNKVFSNHANLVNLTGKTSLLALTELVKNAKKVVAPDTGIVHIAKSVGTPADALYKTTRKDVWGYK